jgi:hypothetical protein
VSLRQRIVSGLAMILATIAMFLVALFINLTVFANSEFAPGIAWIFLPAGVRLLALLLFAEAGAIGLLLVSWGVGFFLFFPDAPVRAFAGGIVATAAPYAVYAWARRHWAFGPNLSNLTPPRLLVLALACSVASPLLHHLWFAVHGDAYSWHGFIAMIVGDLAGCIVVLYGAKTLLFLLRLLQVRSR